MFSVLAAFAAAVSVVNAADELSWVFPTPRGPTGDGSTTAPCGGYDPSSTRTEYPLTGTNIIFNASTLMANVNVMHVNESNPTRFHTFSTYTQSVLAMSMGQYCAPGPDFSTLNGYAAGTDATLLIIYQNYNGNASAYEYTCADITLVEASSFSAPSDLVCSNSSAIIDLAPLELSLRLTSENFTNSQMGEDGQQIVIANAPTGTVESATVATITDATTVEATDAHGRTRSSTSGAATTSVAATASATGAAGASGSSGSATASGSSASATGAATSRINHAGVGSLLAVAGLLSVFCM